MNVHSSQIKLWITYNYYGLDPEGEARGIQIAVIPQTAFTVGNPAEFIVYSYHYTNISHMNMSLLR